MRFDLKWKQLQVSKWVKKIHIVHADLLSKERYWYKIHTLLIKNSALRFIDNHIYTRKCLGIIYLACTQNQGVREVSFLENFV